MFKRAKAPVFDPREFIKMDDLSRSNPLGEPYAHVTATVPLGALCVIRADHGHGKTPLLLTMAGRMAPTGGTLEVAGYPVPKKRNKVMKLAGLGLFPGLNDVEENLTAPSLLKAELDIYNKPTNRAFVDEYLESYDLLRLKKTRIRDYEQVDLIQLGIALGMAGDPLLLAVDDVEDQLTGAQSERLLTELREMAREKNIVAAVACTDERLAKFADVVIDLDK